MTVDQSALPWNKQRFDPWKDRLTRETLPAYCAMLLQMNCCTDDEKGRAAVQMMVDGAEQLPNGSWDFKVCAWHAAAAAYGTRCCCFKCEPSIERR
jgi:hypothetical protein